MDAELKEALDGLRAEIEGFRSATEANFQALKTQLNMLEYGVLTIAQRLLAESEVQEIRTRMRKAAAG